MGQIQRQPCLCVADAMALPRASRGQTLAQAVNAAPSTRRAAELTEVDEQDVRDRSIGIARCLLFAKSQVVFYQRASGSADGTAAADSLLGTADLEG